MKHSYNFKDLTGQRFGRLLVISLNYIDNGKAYWNCKCDCGNQLSVLRSSLTSGNTKSCGCLHKELAKNKNYRHGLANTRIYKIWVGMKKRCNNRKCKNYKDYGARGIQVCEEWSQNFTNFYNWAIENGYGENLSIDRVNVNGDYEPSNCRWVTQTEQTRNARSNVKITIKGQTKLLSEWARESGIDRRTISRRIGLGWRNDELLRPIKQKGE